MLRWPKGQGVGDTEERRGWGRLKEGAPPLPARYGCHGMMLPTVAQSFYFLKWSWKSSFSCDIASFSNLVHIWKRREVKPNDTSGGCPRPQPPRSDLGWAAASPSLVQPQAPSLPETKPLRLTIWRSTSPECSSVSALFQITNMGIICFDWYFHILHKTVIEKPFRHRACIRTLQPILEER